MTEIQNLQVSAEKLNVAVQQYEQWFALAAKEIELIKIELEDLEKELNCSDVTLQLKNELANVKNKVSWQDRRESFSLIILTSLFVPAVGYRAKSHVIRIRHSAIG